jgi:hypothetical protein
VLKRIKDFLKQQRKRKNELVAAICVMLEIAPRKELAILVKPWFVHSRPWLVECLYRIWQPIEE